MATYRELVGKKIKKVTSDPSTGIDGQMWYNSTTGALRGLGVVTAWVSSGNLTAGRANGGGSGSLQNSALFCGGYTTAGTAVTEEYNGSSSHPKRNR